VSNRFVFEWNVNIGDTGMNPETAYPGDAYVDIIGMDFYWNTQWDPADPIQAWNSMLNRSYGLAWHQRFAAAHGKRTSYSEWGVMSNNAGPYIEKAKEWFASHPVVFQTYWNSNAAFPGKLSDNQYPNTGAAYRAAFRTP
jgi:beta-mannanase